jgi:hypothetical protein
MFQDMRRHVFAKTGARPRGIPSCTLLGDGTATELDYVTACRSHGVPPPQVRYQHVWNGQWRPTLLGLAFFSASAIDQPAFKVDPAGMR